MTLHARMDAGPLVAMVIASLLAVSTPSSAEEPPALQVAPFELPAYSDLLSPASRAGLARWKGLREQARRICDRATKTTGPEIRACEAQMYAPLLAEARRTFDVKIERGRLGGVPISIVTPARGAPAKNARRVLIYAHGGGFQFGSGPVAELEALPVAALGGYRVVVVDYRLAPEHRFPAASDDITSVYASLLTSHAPSEVGLYGCSAGGRLVGQALATIAARRLPRPAAVAMLCSAPTSFGGDSNTIAAAINGLPPRSRDFAAGYFKDVSPTDPIAFPGDTDRGVRGFPPTLLMTSTRDYSLSPMVALHARLMRLGVPTELHVYEGLGHAEYMGNPFLPETRQAARTVADFFNRRLATPGPDRGR